MVQRFNNLDGLRGVCALTVVLFHLGYADHGCMAVDLFFMLSGFVLALNYERRLRDGMPFYKFIAARGRRLLPIYWMGLLACVGAIEIALHGGNISPTKLIMAVALIPSPTFDGNAYPLNPITWSLAAEWFVCILFAGTFYRLRTALLAITAIAAWSAMASISFYLPRSWDIGMTTGALFLIAPLRAIPAFCVGIVLYRLKDHPRMHALPVISPVALFALWLALAVIPKPVPTPVLDAMIAIMAAPLLIALLMRSEDHAPRWCAAIGRLSYPLYASHLAVLKLVEGTPVLGTSNGRPTPFAAILIIILALALAWCIAWANDRIQDRIRPPIMVMKPAGAE